MQTVSGVVVMDAKELETLKQTYIKVGAEIGAKAALEHAAKSRLLTVKEVADRVGKHYETVKRWAQSGHPILGMDMGFFRIDSTWAITEYDFNQALEKLKS